MHRNRFLILRDCTRAMLPSIIIYIIRDSLVAQLTIIIADVLGKFADAIFDSNLSWGLENLHKIILCLIASIFIIPLIGLLGEKLMFSNALKHDRIILDRFLDKKYDNILTFDAGSAQYRLENDPNELRKQWLEIVEKCIVTPIVSIVLLIKTFKISIIYTIITICISLLKLLIPIFTRKIDAKFDLMNIEYNTQLRANQTEISTNSYAISMLNIKNGFLNKIDCMFKNYFEQIFKKKNRISAIIDLISTIINTSSTLIIFISGSILVANGAISPGAILAMMTYLSSFDLVFGNIASTIKEISIFKNIYMRISDLYSNPECKSGINIKEFNLIEVKGLSYKFGDKIALSTNDFNIKKGEKIAVCGLNGSGKTTLINILSSLLLDYQGSIFINGISMKNISIESIRKKISVALQEPFIFSGTIKENIVCGDYENVDAINDIINNIGIENIADRYITSKSSELSGGEKQKISIARCLMKNCDIIILDEPTNNLDQDSLEWLYNFIANTKKTIIYVSHSDRFTKLANKTIIL